MKISKQSFEEFVDQRAFKEVSDAVVHFTHAIAALEKLDALKCAEYIKTLKIMQASLSDVLGKILDRERDTS
jgi:putative oxidoreductase